MALKSEHVSAIAALGAATGAVANEKIKTPLTGSGLIPFAVGAIIAFVGYKFIKMDGAGDFVEGFGIGMAVDAII
jgi:hypothetical protein